MLQVKPSTFSVTLLPSTSESFYRTDSSPVLQALSQPPEPTVEDFDFLSNHRLSDAKKRERFMNEAVVPTRALDGTLSVEISFYENRYGEVS